MSFYLTKTTLILTKFTIKRYCKPININAGYWNDNIGIDVSNLLCPQINTTKHQCITRNSGMSIRIIETDNVQNLGEYKKGDIIKSRGSYIQIEGLEISNNFYVIGEDLGTGLKRRYPLTMREMKVYNNLSDKVKNRIAKEKEAFLERKKNFSTTLKEMLKERTSQTKTIRSVSPIGVYRVERK